MIATVLSLCRRVLLRGAFCVREFGFECLMVLALRINLSVFVALISVCVGCNDSFFTFFIGCND